MANIRINTYRLASDDSERIIKDALKILFPSLPISLPLYRRLQFGRFLDATVLLTNLDLSNAPCDLSTPYLLAFVDRSSRPETEVWLYASWESQPSPPQPGGHEDELLGNLVKACKALGTPESIHQDLLAERAREDELFGDLVKACKAMGVTGSLQERLRNEGVREVQDAGKDHLGLSRKDYASHANNPDVMLWGAVHENSMPVLDRLGFLSEQYNVARTPNCMFIFDVDRLPPSKPLPEGLRWGEVKREHFALVRSRTQIPRQDRTMAVLPSVAIYPEGEDEPVAWVFVGLDASETTLYVEQEYRGRGLAKAIATKLFREKMSKFWGDDWGYRIAHANVINGNEQSVGVCKSLHGKSDWEVYWLRVDLTQLRD